MSVRHTYQKALASVSAPDRIKRAKAAGVDPIRYLAASDHRPRNATAHALTRHWRTVPGLPATDFDGDKRVNGALVKVEIACTASHKKTGRGQNRAVVAQNTATREADACKLYAKIREKCDKGGSWFNACKGRASRKRLRALVHAADKDAARGDFRAALATLKGF